MQPNYEEMMKRQQQDYQRSRDPFQYGQQVAQRRYSEIMSNLDSQRQATQQSYGDLYSQARQRAVRGQAMGGPTLSGGMGQQQKDYVSAIEMQELGRIGQAREGASRDLYSQGQAAFSNAQLEGQQATQMEVQNQQTQLQLVQQRQAILADKNLSDEQRAQQLEALGTSPDAVAEKQRTWDQWLATGAIATGTGAVAIGGVVKLAGVVKASSALRSAYMAATVASRAMGSAPLLSAFAKVAPAGKLALAGLGKVGGMVATSMALHPVGWAIGAIVVGSLLVATIAGAARNS
jgi:hypothetical protein